MFKRKKKTVQSLDKMIDHVFKSRTSPQFVQGHNKNAGKSNTNQTYQKQCIYFKLFKEMKINDTIVVCLTVTSTASRVLCWQH